jgi:hypothetical protein
MILLTCDVFLFKEIKKSKRRIAIAAKESMHNRKINFASIKNLINSLPVKPLTPAKMH